jgi:hypothetical protein
MEKPASDVRRTGSASEKGWSNIEKISTPERRVKQIKTMVGTTRTVV